MKKEKLWTKDFIGVALTNFLLTLILYSLLVTIPSYTVEQFHSSTSTAGLVSGIFIIGALFGRIVIGRFIGDLGGKKTLFIGLLSYIITSVLYLGAFNLPLLLINRIIHGMAFGVSSTAAGTIMAQIIPYNRRGEGIGYFGMSSILSTAIGPFLGIYLSQHTGFKMIFIMNIVLSIICFCMSLIVKEPVNKSFKQEKIKGGKAYQISDFLEIKALPISIISLIIGFSFSGILAFLSFYSREAHIVGSASFFFLVYAISILVSRPFSGRLFDIKGANIVVFPCLLIYALGMFMMCLVHSGFVLLIAASIVGLGYGNFQSTAQAIALKGVASNRLGLATATFYIFLDLGSGMGPYLLGFLVSYTGYRGLYLTMVFVILVAIVLYYFLAVRKASIERSPDKGF